MRTSASVPHRIPLGAVSPDLCWWEFEVSASELLLTVFTWHPFFLCFKLSTLSDYPWSTGPGKAGLRVENSTFWIAWFPPRKGLTGWHPMGVYLCTAPRSLPTAVFASHMGDWVFATYLIDFCMAYWLDCMALPLVKFSLGDWSSPSGFTSKSFSKGIGPL